MCQTTFVKLLIVHNAICKWMWNCVWISIAIDITEQSSNIDKEGEDFTIPSQEKSKKEKNMSMKRKRKMCFNKLRPKNHFRTFRDIHIILYKWKADIIVHPIINWYYICSYLLVIITFLKIYGGLYLNVRNLQLQGVPEWVIA